MIFFVRASMRYNSQINPNIIQTMISPFCDINNIDNSNKNLPSNRPIYVPTEIPEPPTTCCMSGCANCVWIEYADKLSEIFQNEDERIQKEILDRVTDTNMQAYLTMELRNLKARKESDIRKT